ncbi:MAG: ribosomal protein L11 methyltransferase [Pseudohongiellaceae bacterium]|jgi:ribosomal protein L11 methyltransferase
MHPDHWTEVTLQVPPGWGELVADELAAWAGGQSVGLETVNGVITARAWRQSQSRFAESEDAAAAELRQRFADLAQRSGCDELADLRPSVRRIADRDWAASWRDSWRPFRVGRVVILPAGHEAPVRDNDIVLRVDPGRAFGTGRHGSTRGCLKALQQRLVPGQRVIDAGCGSGILAVVAALLGADEVTAFDVDIEAVRHTERLAREHGVSDRIVLAVADLDLLEQLDRPTDGLLANIDESVLVPQAGKLTHCLRVGSWFALGGTRADKADQLAPALAANGLTLDRVEASARWRTHIGQRSLSPQPSVG